VPVVHPSPPEVGSVATTVGAVKVVIDADACTGHGRCYSLWPDVFDADEQGHSVVIGHELGPDQLLAVEAAVSNCPEHAISLVD
jgi:ferredoxin